MRVAINGWFLGQAGTGSGQYLRSLLAQFATLAPTEEFLLAVPPSRIELEIPHLSVRFWSFGSKLWRTDLGKVWFEQVAFPRLCARFGADVAHIPYWGSPLRPTVPTLVTVHDVIPLLLPAYRSGPLVRLYTRLVAASARRAAGVLTDSLSSKHDIEASLGLPSERVRCVYLAAEEYLRAEASADDGMVRDRYGIRGRYVLYLAGHDVRKNVAGLLETFGIVSQSVGDVTLVVGGRLPEEPRSRSLLRGKSPLIDPRPLVKRLELEDRVQFIGWVEERDKPAVYRGAACAVFPSRYEGFGLPVLEALACGTPLVASNRGSLAELMGDAGFAVDPDDVKSLAGAILACLMDESLAEELRRRGPAQAARFTWNQTARETLDAYDAARRPPAEN